MAAGSIFVLSMAVSTLVAADTSLSELVRRFTEKRSGQPTAPPTPPATTPTPAPIAPPTAAPAGESPLAPAPTTVAPIAASRGLEASSPKPGARKPSPPLASLPPPKAGGARRILLVDDDWDGNIVGAQPSGSDKIFRALVAAAVEGDAAAWSTEMVETYKHGPAFERLRDFNVIIWYTGGSYGGGYDGRSTLSVEDEKVARRYLQEVGGAFILISPGFMTTRTYATTWTESDNPFLNEVMGVNGIASLAKRFEAGTVRGADGTNFAVEGKGVIETQFSAINPDGAAVVFTSTLDPRKTREGPVPIASAHPFGGGRFVYVGFSFENIVEAERAKAFNLLLDAATGPRIAPAPATTRGVPIVSRTDAARHRTVEIPPAPPHPTVANAESSQPVTPPLVVLTPPVRPVRPPLTGTQNPTSRTLPLSLCLDQPPATGALPPRDYSAIQPPVRINRDGSLPTAQTVRQPLAGETSKMWNPGQTINVYMYPLTSASLSALILEKLKFYARQWEAVANITFKFVNTPAEGSIRIYFGADGRNWSLVGRDALFASANEYTMYFGSFTNLTSEVEFKSIILHEFGHVLGFIHEHQSPSAGIQWDKEKVYAILGAPPTSWPRERVDLNLFEKYSASTTNFSQYDPTSIMHYWIDPEFTLDGFSVPINIDLSPTDIAFVKQVYPFPPQLAENSGTLQTGDDCDLVDFVVEYNVVPADNIEFSLELGNNGSQAVTWWKQITIPLKNNGKKDLWVQNHSLIAAENVTRASAQIAVTDLDPTKRIAFAKAKFLGVHTPLSYSWDIVRALPGGCRVRLTWRNDRCP
ncbi:M12 family metallopeptidase [Horticoccus sp. 23ND18S-11]|uniref:M12 family metallopeptidase n=1 Tax=Horticoccus sp. 23ND18S-11 TaxID=3391832 RepID=UPI0039C95606